MSKIRNLVQAHRALADPTRLRILHLLDHEGELCVCDVEAVLGVTQSKASRHLVCLRQAGLLEDRRDGTWVYYRLARESAPVMKRFVRALRDELADETDAQGDLERADRRRRDPTCTTMRKVRGGRARSASPVKGASR